MTNRRMRTAPSAGTRATRAHKSGTMFLQSTGRGERVIQEEKELEHEQHRKSNLHHRIGKESAILGRLMSQVWLITGSSRGFGHAFAEAALKAENRVLATARRE